MPISVNPVFDKAATGFFQSKASWVSALLLGVSTCVGPTALAEIIYPDNPAPDKGDFDWTQFEGKFDFVKYQSHPSAIWEDRRPDTFVQIDNRIDYTRNLVSLELMRANTRNPIALAWSVERIGQGRQTQRDADTDKVVKVMESYTTVDGVYGMMAWDRPFNTGWSTLQLRMDAQRNISITIRQFTDSDISPREETCTLMKHVPKINV